MGGGPGAAGSGNFAQSPTSRGFPIADPKAESRSAETSLSHCSGDFFSQRECIADAIEAYARALSELSPALPPQLRGLPDIVSRAAKRVRAARTMEGAVRAITSAIAEVKKTISLLRADDPEILEAETRAGAFAAETLEVADNKLEKAVGP
jgi:hypothetical protein